MKEVTANMAGVVLRLMVSPGDQITSGQDVVCLESMKMEVNVNTMESGEVKEIKVGTGDFVNEGDVLMVLE
ncbi:MAG: biotin/lipoyl-containing protein [Thermincolia bacterium]